MQKKMQPIDHINTYPALGINLEKSGPLKKLAISIIPAHTLAPFVQELRLAWLRFKTRNVPQKYTNAKDLLVNLGAGWSGQSGWINVDAFPLPGVNCVYDCRKHLPFPDNSVKGIFCHHFFEHIDYTEEVPYFLTECYRVLQVGGIIRLIVPDAEKIIQAYLTNGWDQMTTIKHLDSERRDPCFREWGGYNTKMEVINVVFRQHYEHKYAYDYTTLEFLLYKYGFSLVKRQELGKSLMNELCLDTTHPSIALHSLYVEGVKEQ